MLAPAVPSKIRPRSTFTHFVDVIHSFIHPDKAFRRWGIVINRSIDRSIQPKSYEKMYISKRISYFDVFTAVMQSSHDKKKKQPSQWLTPILRPITPSTTNGKRHFGINVDLSPHPSLPVRYLWTILLLISVIYPKRQTTEKNNKHLSDAKWKKN